MGVRAARGRIREPENYFTVREVLIQAGRADLIGNGCDCLIPARPPKEAVEARRRPANEAANPAKGEPVGERGLPNPGYRPGRKSARRQDKNRKQKGGGSARAGSQQLGSRTVSKTPPRHLGTGFPDEF